jgi:Fe-S oxidoreductase
MHRHFGLPAWAEQLKARMPAASIYWQAGCQSQMPPESFDALSFAAQRWPPLTAVRAAGTKVALWLPCLLSASAERAGAVRAWWQASLGQALLKLPDQFCCGAGGLKFGAAAGDALADRVLNSALDAGCKTLLALGSCALQLRARALSRKLALEIAHPFVWLEKIGEFT